MTELLMHDITLLLFIMIMSISIIIIFKDRIKRVYKIEEKLEEQLLSAGSLLKENELLRKENARLRKKTKESEAGY